MGQRVMQRIFSCEECHRIPEDGETMWEMGIRVLCNDCAEKHSDSDELEEK